MVTMEVFQLSTEKLILIINAVNLINDLLQSKLKISLKTITIFGFSIKF